MKKHSGFATNKKNMKRIILSLTMIVAVGAIVIASTGAFFNDTETSTGNKFVAGEIDLLVDSQAHYAGLVCDDMDEEGVFKWRTETDGGVTTRVDLIGDSCNGTWEETDLGPTHQFFNYGDLKPGDYGENTISLHVENNDAYMCAIIDNMVDDDNGCNEPEGKVDGTCGDNEGDLSKELHFFAWADNYSTENGIEQCDNKWQSNNEPMLFSNTSGPASDVLGGRVYPMYMPNTSVGALKGDTTTCIGMYWCYGTISTVDGVLSCDGELVTNMSQSDSMTADISFYVEQARNNEDFTCPELPFSESAVDPV